jgi:hypothetical protein
MKLLKTLKELEEKFGEDLVDEELEKICLQRGVPHIEESCLRCMIDNDGWVYCEDSRHHVDHPRHVCPIMQECLCCASD